MRTRLHNSRGFTLSELLVTVAIIVILAAIAVPAIASLQRNMHFVELENAATQIAQAAQNQMTAKKVSGTWFDLLDSDPDNAAQATPDPDIFYFTADQARKNGVLPRNSIDDTVWQGDFIIEYSRLTATVRSVFYSDGRSGVFANTPTTGTPAQTYYENGGSRFRDDRLNADPPIGYYEGTPAGATDAVALQTPMIWVEAEGALCIQNPNLGEQYPWAKNSVLTVKVTKLDAQGAETTLTFELEGLQGNATSGQVTSYFIAAADQRIATTPGEEVTLAERNDTALAKDVFVFDLTRMLEKMTALDPALAAVAAQFTYDDDLRIDATINTSELDRRAIPATTSAFTKFPHKTPRISVLVTNPDYRREGTPRAIHLNQSDTAYTDPDVKVLTYDTGGEPVVPNKRVKQAAPEMHQIQTTAQALKQANPTSAYQAYTGGFIEREEIDSNMFIRATVGAYNSGLSAHKYQSFELWVNTTRVGFLRNNEWWWGEHDEYNALLNVITAPFQGSTLQTIEVRLDDLALYLEAVGIAPDRDDCYTIYLRTAPDAGEVAELMGSGQAFDMIRTYANELGGTLGSRSAVTGEYTDLRNLVEAEFGASSAVASWLTTLSSDSGIADFPSTNILATRIYYAGTPAVGFNSALDATANKLDNAVMWYFEDVYRYPQAMVVQPRAGDGLEPLHLTNIATTLADFEIPHTQDQLFCRVLFYHDENGSLIPNWSYQYVPYSAQIDAATATIANDPSPRPGYSFAWATQNTYPSVFEQQCVPGRFVGNYSDNLAFGRIDLRATYVTRLDSVGLVYYEEYADGSRGVYGFTDKDSTSFIDTLDYSGKMVDNYGYYAVAPEGTTKTIRRTKNGEHNLTTKVAPAITIGMQTYERYDLKIQDFELRDNIPVGLSYVGDPTISDFFINVKFAKAVTTSATIANQWGLVTSTYPFIIRHCDQFFACNPESYLTEPYTSLSYRQESPLDFRTAQVAINYGSHSFTGMYDGGSQPVYGCPVVNFGYGNNAAGLFMRTAKNAETGRNAVIKNVVLDYANYGTIAMAATLSGASPFELGFLSGSSADTTFTNCHIKGGVDNGAGVITPLTIVVGSPTDYGDLYIGGIVGSGTNCVFTDCSIENVSFRYVSNRKAATHLGSLVGHISGSNSKILRTQKSRVMANAVLLWSAAHQQGVSQLYIGGLVGSKELGINIGEADLVSPVSFTNVTKRVNNTAAQTVTNIVGTGGGG